MRFSKFIALVCPDEKDPAEKYAESLAQIQLADDAGFHGIWLSENHFSSKPGLPGFKGEIGITPKPLMFGMKIVENTQQIRVGTAVRNIVFSNPLLVAEEALVFDLLSKGRLDLGVGSGYRPWEFTGFRIDRNEAKDRFLEALEILDRGMRGEPFSFKGRYFDIPEVSLVPKPYYTRPRPKIFIATGDMDQVKLAAEKDYGVMSFSTSSREHLLKLYDTWREIAAPLGYDTSRDRFPVTRQIYIHRDPAVADEYAARNLPYYQAALGDFKACPPLEELKKLYIIGAPEDCVTQLSRLRDEMGCTHVILWFNFGWLTHREVMEQMQLFAEEVMPHFADEKRNGGLLMKLDLPWAPIYTVTRSSQPELTVFGLMYVWVEDRSLMANLGRSLIKIGDMRAPVWSRSLLKPWQFMVIYPVLKHAYPQLTERHFALMTASHQSDAAQLQLLEELLALGKFSEEDLQCPACLPMNMHGAGGGERHSNRDGASGRRIYNACSGKHLGYLLYLKARGLPIAHYLDRDSEPYAMLRALLGYLLNQEPDTMPETIDGCGMPNYAFTAIDMAQLYHALALPASRDLLQQAPEEIEALLTHWDEISALMRKYPEIVGGENRLDTCLMQIPGLTINAKEGADGLLAVGIGPNKAFADGLGVFIKLSSGYEPAQLEKIIFALLAHLELTDAPPTDDSPAHVQTHFHFSAMPAPAWQG